MKMTSIIPERGGVEVTEAGNVKLLFFLPTEGFTVEMSPETWDAFTTMAVEKRAEAAGLALPEKPKIIVPA
jgi:hypothetical protein